MGKSYLDAIAIVKAEIADLEDNPLRLQSDAARNILLGLKRALYALEQTK